METEYSNIQALAVEDEVILSQHEKIRNNPELYTTI